MSFIKAGSAIIMLLLLVGWFFPAAASGQVLWEYELIMQLRPETVGSADFERLSRDLNGSTSLVRLAGFPRTFVVGPVNSRARDQIEKALRHNPAVAHVQRNFTYRASFVPNDSYYAKQWNLQTVQAEAAWDLDTTPPLYGGDPSVIIAVLDSGFSPGPDFAQIHRLPGRDFVDNDDDPADDNGHGTHVTGTLVEQTNNEIGAAGLAFESTVLPLKVLNSRGEGSTATIAQAITYAVEQGAKVINLSLGGGDDDPLLHAALISARQAGAVVVAATGNEAATSLSFPAKYDEVIAVGAIRFDETRSAYSNSGTGIDLVAPGGDLSVDQNGDGTPDGVIQQTCATSECTSFDQYLYVGTSQAAPHVSGAAALLLAAGADSGQIPATLIATAKDLGPTGYDPEYGYGLVDVAAALRAVIQDTAPPTGTLAINQGAENTGATAVTLTIAGSDASGVGLMQLSNDGQTYTVPEPFTAEVSWDLSRADVGGTAIGGVHTVFAKLTDTKGNTSEPISSSIILDLTPPQDLSIAGYATRARKRSFRSGERVTLDRPYFVFRASDSSGIDGYAVSWTTAAEPPAKGSYQIDSAYTPPKAKLGTMYLHVRAIDKAGNTGEPVTFIFRRGTGFVAATSLTKQGATIRLLDGKTTEPRRRLTVSGSSYKNGLSLAHGDLNADGNEEFVLAPVRGQVSVSVISARGKVLKRFEAFTPGFKGGGAVTVGDATGDGQAEIIVVPAKGAAHVSLFDADGELIRRFFAVSTSYRDGATVALVERDGAPAIAVGRLKGSPTVYLYSAEGKLLKTIRAFNPSLTKGVELVSGDVNADGQTDLIVVPASGSCTVRVLNSSGKKLFAFTPPSTVFPTGCRVSAGDVDGDGRDEIILAGSGSNTAQALRVFEADGKPVPSLLYPASAGLSATFLAD